MAKPISRTPLLKGRDAVAVLDEIRNGTPPTPERTKLLSEARQVYDRHRKDAQAAN